MKADVAETTGQTMKEKVSSIENSREKNVVRIEMDSQICQYIKVFAKRYEATPLTMRCFPAENWYQETALLAMLRNPFFFDKVKPMVQFYGIESVKKTAEESLKMKPECATLTCCSLEDFIKYKVHFNQFGAGFVTDTERDSKVYFDVEWNDCCCEFDKEALAIFTDSIKNTRQGLRYITFKITTRKRGGTLSYLSSLYGRKYKKMSKDGAVRAIIEDEIARVAPQQRVKLIYCCVYGGGGNGSTPMITLGFSVNVPNNAITPLFSNRMDECREVKTKTRNFIYKMQEQKTWEMKPRKTRKGWAKKTTCNQSIIEKNRLRKKVKTRLLRGWTSEKIADNLNKMYNMNLTAGQVGSIKAWLNPKGKLASRAKTF